MIYAHRSVVIYPLRVVKRVFGIGEHGAEAHFVVGFERWGRPWGGAGIEFRTDSEQMGRREFVIG